MSRGFYITKNSFFLSQQFDIFCALITCSLDDVIILRGGALFILMLTSCASCDTRLTMNDVLNHQPLKVKLMFGSGSILLVPLPQT